MPLNDYKLTAFTESVSDLETDPNLTEVALKAAFDAAANELREEVNNAIDFLQGATDSDSGADNIGCTEIAGGYGETVQSNLEGLKADLDGVALGAIPNDSIGTEQMVANMKRGIAGGLATYNDFVQKTATVQGQTLSGEIKLFAADIYTGDGAASRSITLGFTPSVVFVFPESINTASPTFSSPSPYISCLGMALNGCPQKFRGKDTIKIVANGFDVFYGYGGETSESLYPHTNTNGRVYKYVAFK